MKNEPLEKFFRDKLGEMVIEPSRAAQENFKEKIRARALKIMTRRIGIAASILLVALIGFYSFFPGRTEKPDLAQDEMVKMKKNHDMTGKDEDVPGNKNQTMDDGRSSKDGLLVETNHAPDTEQRRNNELPEIENQAKSVELPMRTESDELMVDDQGAKKAERSSEINKTMAYHSVEEDRSAEHSQELNEKEKAFIPGEPTQVSAPLQPDHEVIATGDELLAGKEGKDQQSALSREMAWEPQLTEQTGGNAYTEGSSGEQGSGKETRETTHEPVKITIEYISSGGKQNKHQAERRDFYSKMDNIKGMDEVYGDLREYKDRLFALDFINSKKVKTEEK